MAIWRPGTDLGVQRFPGYPAEQAERLQPGRYVGGGVRVQSGGAALVTGIERTQQVDHLGAPALPDDQPVRPHPQRLPDQLAQPDRAGTLHIGRSSL